MRTLAMLFVLVVVASCADSTGPTEDHDHAESISNGLSKLISSEIEEECAPGYETISGHCWCTWCGHWFEDHEHDDAGEPGDDYGWSGSSAPYGEDDGYPLQCNEYLEKECKLRWKRDGEWTDMEERLVLDAIRTIQKRCSTVADGLTGKFIAGDIALWDARILRFEVLTGNVQRPLGTTSQPGEPLYHAGHPSIWTAYNATSGDYDLGRVNWPRSLAHEMLHIQNPYDPTWGPTRRTQHHQWIEDRAEYCAGG